MPRITCAEARNFFDDNNPNFTDGMLDLVIDDNDVEFAIKDSNLLGLFREFMSEERYPLLDKASGVIFAGNRSSHELIGSALYVYYHGMSELDTWQELDEYVASGMGYFVSYASRGSVVVGLDYRPDKLDEALFDQLKTIRGTR